MTTDTAALGAPIAFKPIRSELLTSRRRAAMVFLLPMIIALVIVAGWPLYRTIYFSLTDATLETTGTAKFVGFQNYFSAITLHSGKTFYSGVLADPAWWNAVWNTVRFAFVSVLLETIFGTVVALVLNAEFPGRGLVRAAILTTATPVRPPRRASSADPDRALPAP